MAATPPEAASSRAVRRKSPPAAPSRPISPGDKRPDRAGSQAGPPSPSSHSGGSFSVYNSSIALQTGVQDLVLCIHNDFVVSDSPVVVHLGRDSVSLGTQPPSDGARNIHNIGLLRPLGDAGEEELGDKEHARPADKGENDGTAEGDRDRHVSVARHGRQQQKQQRRMPDPASGPDLAQRSRSLGFRVAVAIALLLVFFVGPRHRVHGPVAEYTLIKPLDPSPDTSFADLMQRHAAAPSAVVGSGATDKKVYSALLWDVDEYCGVLRQMLAADWARNLYAPNRALQETGWRQWQVWKQGLARDGPYHGPAHARAKSLCESFTVVLTPLGPDIVVPLHRIMVSFWGAHAVSGLLTAARGLEKLFTVGRDGTLPLEAGVSPASSSLDDQDLDGSKSSNSSLAIAVLWELSSGLALTHEASKSGIANLKALNESLGRVVMLGAEVLEPRWEQWLALNHPGGRTAQAEGEAPSQSDLRRLASLGDRARGSLSALKDVQGRFSGPAAEALAVTGSDYEQLNGQINSLIAGHGWTRLVQHQEQWVLDWYYFSFPADLPAWLNSLAENITVRLDEFAKGDRARDDAEEQVRLASYLADENDDGFTARLLKSMNWKGS